MPLSEPFTLSNEDDFDRYSGENITIFVSDHLSTDEEACDTSTLPLLSSYFASQTFPWGSGLNPFRKPQLLCRDIFDLLTSQLKLIAMDPEILGLCESICKSTVMSTLSSKNPSNPANASAGMEIQAELWGQYDGANFNTSSSGLDEERTRGRSLSPTNRRSRSQGRQAHSIGRKGRTIDSSSPVPIDGDPVDSTETAQLRSGNDRRSRSTSSGPQRSLNRGLSASSKVPPKQSKSATSGNKPSPIPSDQVPSLFSTLKCFPSEINRYVNGTKGPIHGIWITDHPLSSLPASYYETVSLIDSFPSSALADNKRVEWEMDLLREYDDKRMERLEEYLTTCRKNVDEQIKSTSRRDEKYQNKKSSESKK